MAPQQQQQPPPPGDTDNVDEDHAADDADDLSDLQQPELRREVSANARKWHCNYRISRAAIETGRQDKKPGRTQGEPAVLMDTTAPPPLLRLIGNKSTSDSPLPLG